MSSIIERNKEIMKKFEKMICNKDTAIQEKLGEELVFIQKTIFHSSFPRTIVWGKRLFIFCIFNEKIIF